MNSKIKNKKGFTLVELLVVIAIIGILAVVAVPALFKNIDKAKISSIEADYSALKSAALTYYADNGDIENVRIEDLNQYIEGGIKHSTPMGGNYQLYSVYNLNSNIPGTTENQYWRGMSVNIKNGELVYGKNIELKEENSMFIGIRGVHATKSRLEKLVNDLGENIVYVYSNDESYKDNIIYLKLIDFNN